MSLLRHFDCTTRSRRRRSARFQLEGLEVRTAPASAPAAVMMQPAFERVEIDGNGPGASRLAR